MHYTLQTILHFTLFRIILQKKFLQLDIYWLTGDLTSSPMSSTISLLKVSELASFRNNSLTNARQQSLGMEPSITVKRFLLRKSRLGQIVVFMKSLGTFRSKVINNKQWKTSLWYILYDRADLRWICMWKWEVSIHRVHKPPNLSLAFIASFKNLISLCIEQTF